MKRTEIEEFTDLSILCGKTILSVKVFNMYEEGCELDRHCISFSTNNGTYDFYTACRNSDCGCPSMDVRLSCDNIKDGDIIRRT